MDKIDIILTVMITGYGLVLSLMAFMWNSINTRLDRTDARMDRLESKLDKLDEKLTDVDRRLCRLEGAFSSKDCCMIKEDRSVRVAE